MKQLRCSKIFSLNSTSGLTFLVLFIVINSAFGAQYFLDGLRGNDTVGVTFKTWEALRPRLRGGDTVTVATGNYGTIVEAQTPEDVFPSLVTVKAAKGAEVHFESIVFGRNGSAFVGHNRQGSYDGNMKFVGIRVDDGVNIYGGRNIQFENCLFEREGPWTGSNENIEKIAFLCRFSSRLSIRNCEVTRTGIGLCLSGSDLEVLHNTIHDITHDGIRCVGLSSSLFEGNRIHGLDDGVTDAQAAWSRHSDAIHIFIAGAPTIEGIIPNSDLTFRGNVIYDIESLGVQFNNFYMFPEIVNNGIVFENNIFGATGAIAFNVAGPVDGLLFRHNSFIPGTRTYTSPHTESGRTISCSNSSLRISAECSDVQIYNNILGAVLMEMPDPDLFDFNLILLADTKSAYPRFTVVTNENPYANAPSLNGALTGQSAAVNAGTIVAWEALCANDLYGTTRDGAPDLGAYEVPGLNPGPAPVASAPPVAPLSYVDDFEDGNLTADPYLNNNTQAGLAWSPSPSRTSSFTVARRDNWRNCLSSPFAAGTESVILALPALSWDQYSFSFSADNAYLTRGIGPVLLYRDPENYFMLDIGRDSGNLIWRRDGIDTIVAGIPSARMPHSGVRNYLIDIKCSQGDTNIFVDADANGTYEIIHTIPIVYDGESIGFFYSGYQNNLRTVFDNICIKKISP